MINQRLNSKLMFVFSLTIVILCSCPLPKLGLYTKPQDTRPVILSPAGGDRFYTSDKLLIKWDSEKQGFVRLTLCRGGQPVSVICEKTEDDGEYTWQIGNVPIANNYTIKIEIIEGFLFKLDSISSPFILDTPWEDLGPIGAENTANISIAIGNDSLPVIFYSKTISQVDWIYASRWNGSKWIDILPKGMDNNITSYTGTLDNDNIPSIFYNLEYLLGPNIKKYNESIKTWEPLGDFTMLITRYYSLGYSMTIDNLNQPVISYMAISQSIDAYSARVYILSSYWDKYDLTWKHYGNLVFNGTTIDYEKSKPVGDFTTNVTSIYNFIYSSQKKLDVSFTSLGLKSGNIPVIAYLAVKSIDIGQRLVMGQVIVKCWNDKTNVWDPLGDSLSDEKALYTSLAVGKDNLPVVVILENVAPGVNKTIVKKWSEAEQAWQDLDYPILPETGAPTIAIDGKNRPVVATSYGVRHWDREDNAWIDLGYPNYNPVYCSGGTGLPSWWMAIKDNRIMIAFTDPGNPNEIRVKYRDIE